MRYLSAVQALGVFDDEARGGIRCFVFGVQEWTDDGMGAHGSTDCTGCTHPDIHTGHVAAMPRFSYWEVPRAGAVLDP